MTGGTFDQRAWLARIGYAGKLVPTLDTLNGLIHAHPFLMEIGLGEL